MKKENTLFDVEEEMEEVRRNFRVLRRKFLKYKDAEIVYSLEHKKLLELADDAGAIYRQSGTVLINRDIFDEYLERYHQPARMYKVNDNRERKSLEERGNI
ncbi:MAG: hypothetical protein K6G84_09240 [Lachnospiraceae bacterium]|nr:hypothetical protein [Lachnospiraceae bacterium]